MPETSFVYQLVPLGFMAVPKKTTSHTDWSSQIKKSLAEAEEDPGNYSTEMALLNKLRTDATGAEANEAGLMLLSRYYHQLESLICRFPSLQHPDSIQFEWCDAFEPSESTSQSSLAFEKANVCFLMGAAFSKMATVLPATLENLPSMSLKFQAAASVFKWMSETFLHPPLTDLRTASLNLLTAMLLGQAQECILLKAAFEGKSPSLLARLAFAASLRYQKASSILRSSEAESLLESLNSACQAMIFGKALYYAAVAQYYKGEASVQENHHGEALGRLAAAKAYLVELETDYGNDMFGATAFLQQLQCRFDRVEHENLFIYHEQPVAKELLKPVEPADLTTVLGFKETLAQMNITDAGFKDIFGKVLPLKALEELSLYSEQKSMLLRYEKELVDQADEDLEAKKVSLTDPTAPKDSAIEPPVLHLPVLAKEKLVESKKRLADVSGQATQYSAKYGASWTLALPAVNLGETERRLSDLQTSLDELRQEERSLQDNINKVAVQKPAVLIDREPLPDYAKSMKDVVSKMEQLQRERICLLETLKSDLLNDDISGKIVGPGKDPKAIFEEEMKKFSKSCFDIEENVAAHKKLAEEYDKQGASVAEQRRQSGLDQVEAEVKGLRIKSQLLQDRAKYNNCLSASILGVHRTLTAESDAINQELDHANIQFREYLTNAEQLVRSIEENPAFKTQELLRAKLSSLGPGPGAKPTGSNGSLLD